MEHRKPIFAMEWGCFQYIVTSFGIKNPSVIFLYIVITAFKEFIDKFLEIYFDDWLVFGLVKCHVASLCLMFDTCQRYQIALNMKECLLCVLLGFFSGHVVCKKGQMVDADNITIIENFEASSSVK